MNSKNISFHSSSSGSAWTSFKQRYQTILDRATPHPLMRWFFTFSMLTLYLTRVFVIHGFYIITYALGIYLLNLLLAFLTPLADPEFEDTSSSDGPLLPSKQSDEFRPFIRRLPEFKCWLSASRAILLGIFCTFFRFLDIPVFWPILVLYFIILFTFTMRRQIAHMIKYRYLPWSHGKAHYKGKPPVKNPPGTTASLFVRPPAGVVSAPSNYFPGTGPGFQYPGSSATASFGAPGAGSLGSAAGGAPKAPVFGGPSAPISHSRPVPGPKLNQA